MYWIVILLGKIEIAIVLEYPHRVLRAGCRYDITHMVSRHVVAIQHHQVHLAVTIEIRRANTVATE